MSDLSSPLTLQGPSVALVAPVDLAEACLASPAFRAMVNARPELSLTILCPAPAATFWSIHFEEVLPYEEKASPQKLAEFFASQAFDSAIFLEDSRAARALAKLGIPQRIGSGHPDLANLVTDAIPIVEPLGPPRHRIARYLDLAESLSCEARKPENFATPPLAPAPTIPVVALAPDSDLGPAAQWSVESFLKLTELVASEREVSFVVLSLPGKSPKADALTQQLKSADPCLLQEPTNEGNGDLDALLALLPTVSTLVASDGTLPNLAAHLGLPTVTLMGPRAESVHRPLGVIHEPLTTHAECSPCNLAKCPLDHRCLTELTPETVAAAVLKLLSARQP